MIQKLTTTDPVIDEIHRTRRENSDRFGGDLHAILADARKRQAAAGHPVWSPELANIKPMHPSGGGTVADNSETSPAAG